ncbi:MAG: hypothetical protein QW589_01840 [Candidatus Bathyarchaeia archaeon]
MALHGMHAVIITAANFNDSEVALMLGVVRPRRRPSGLREIKAIILESLGKGVSQENI